MNLELLQNNPSLLLERAINSPTLNQVIYQYKAELLSLQSQKELLQRELNDENQQKESLNLELQHSDLY